MANPTNEAVAPWLRDTKGEVVAPSIDKMPQLGSSLSRYADTATQALTALFGGAFDGVLEATESKSTFAFLEAHKLQNAALLYSASMDARLLLIMDTRVTDVIIATMFGVDPAADSPPSPVATAPRPRTELETRLLGELAKSLAGALRLAFAPVATFDLDLESVSTIEDTNLLGAKDMPALATRYALKTPGGSFRMTVVLPQTLTTPLAALFARGPSNGSSKQDPKWTSRMEKGVTRAHMTLTAILDEFELTLGEIAMLSPGDLLPLTAEGEGRVRIECVERGVFVCKLGERANRYALEVEDIIARPIEPPYPEPTL